MSRLDELRVAGMLLTRLPMGRVARKVPIGATGWAWPVIGALVGLIAGLSAGVAGDLPEIAAGAVAVAIGLLVTGAMHEDGLADCADGFGGGATRSRKLEIMRDSRLGSYGAAALCLALVAKAALIGAAGDAALAWLIATGAASRGFLPLMQALMPQARAEGLGARAAGTGRDGIAVAAIIGAVALAVVPGGLGALALLAVVQGAVAMLARRQIGGVSGDVLGAAQVLGEIAALAVLAG
ncbi:adenosylcobinamide-GDP ribazoletransferase [Frigidibacter sp. MR17.24]|uniref:adenosylcobinamide-GDP ribazoletransferase n=1 Tax=Frigidibacter sp. MR17.24 TaxID=3127345 RepID=UPI003012B29B